MAVQDADARVEVCDCPPRQYETCPVCRSVTAVTPSAEVDRLRWLRRRLWQRLGRPDAGGLDIELVEAVADLVAERDRLRSEKTLLLQQVRAIDLDRRSERDRALRAAGERDVHRDARDALARVLDEVRGIARTIDRTVTVAIGDRSQ